MADDGDPEVDTEMFDISTLSEAERRRLRRRQRILGNQGARLQRIINDDSSSCRGEQGDAKISAASIFQDPPHVETIPKGDSVDGPGLRNRDIKKTAVQECHSEPKLSSPVPPAPKRRSSDKGATEPLLTASLLKELSAVAAASKSSGETARSSKPEELRMGVQSDGTVIMPKISEFYGRIMICLLALFLSILNAKRVLITFISWEVAFYFINGLPPLPPPNMAMVLAAVMGLQENQLSRIKKVLHFSNCVMVDFSLFLLFLLMPHIIRSFV